MATMAMAIALFRSAMATNGFDHSSFCTIRTVTVYINPSIGSIFVTQEIITISCRPTFVAFADFNCRVDC